VARLLERAGGHVEDGVATVMTRGRRAQLRLTGETLDSLLPRPSRSIRAGDGWETADGWNEEEIGAAVGPGQASVPGWHVRRDPEPRAWEAGSLVPDLLVKPAGGDLTASVLVCLVRTAAQARRLEALLPSARGGEPLLFAGPERLVDGLRAAGGWTVELDRPALAPLAAVAATRALEHSPLHAEGPATRRRRRVA
jgi:hypothetical protein